MFINLFYTTTFKHVKVFRIILFVLAAMNLNGQQIIKGLVVEKDSTTAMPFVYIINKSNGNGTMSDHEGKFTLSTNPNDTLICSYAGYAKNYIAVSQLKPNSKGEVKLVMLQMVVNLNTVVVSTFKYKPYERDYMKKIIDESKIRKIDYFQSPITALYMQYSKEGRQIRKLAKIFEDIFVEEQVQKKLSPEILKKLTGDDKIDYEAFRKYCYNVSNEFIMSHDGVDLYSKVMECYKRWKKDMGQ